MRKDTPDLSTVDDGKVLVVNPGNEIVHIDQIWAFLSVDKNDNTEGVIGMQTDMGNVPMIAADAVRLLSLMPVVENMAKQTGMTIRLVKFSTREEIKVINGKPGG